MAPDEDDNWDEIDFSGLRLSLNKERGHTTVSPAVALSFNAHDRVKDSSRGFIGLSDTSGVSDKTAESHRIDDVTVNRRLQPSHLDGPSQAHSTQTLPARPAHLGRTALPRHAVQSAGTDRTGPSPAGILTARAPAARILSRYSESADDAADFDCLDVLSTPKQSKDRVGRVQDRLRMGLQPRRHAPSASDLGRIEAWQATTSIAARGQGLQKDVSTEDDDFDLPAGFVLDRHRLVTQKTKARQAPATLALESDDWDGTTGFTDSRGVSGQRYRTRESTGSSSLSLSMTSTVESEDVTDGLELPDTATLDLRQRFCDTRDRRAAGETLRGLSNPHTAHESLLSGLELEPEAFIRAPGIKHVNVRRGIASSPGAGFTQATLRPSGTFRSRPPIPSFGADETMNTQSTRTSHHPSPAATSTTINGRQNGRSPSKENGSPSGTLRSTSARTKPAFLPGGASSSAELSYHVNAISTRQTRLEMDTSTVSATQAGNTARGPTTSGMTGTMRSTPSPIKRRATASEALKTELSKRKPALTHVRSKTYGEGNELDGIEDMPTTTAADRGVIRQRDGTRRRPSGPTAGTASASAATTSSAARIRTRAAMSAEQRLQSFREQRDRSAALQPSTGTRLRPAASQPPLRNPQANLDEAPLRRALQDQTGNVKPGSSRSAPAAASSRSPISSGNPFNTRANLQRNGNTAPSSPKPPRLRSDSLRASKKRKPGVPFLISNLNSIPQPQHVKGMYYNPNTSHWEGNDQEMERFDTVSRTPPRPALISNRVQTASTAVSGRLGQVSATTTTNVNGSGSRSTAQSGAGMKLQVEGDMVFDPDLMCWLKMSAAATGDADSAHGSVSDEEDPFDGIEDLLVDEVPAGSGADLQATNGTAGHAHTSSLSALHGQGSTHAKSEQHFMVGEEFDVGPGFIKRQRAYEAVWQKTTAGWILPGSQQAMLQPGARETRLWELFHLVCD